MAIVEFVPRVLHMAEVAGTNIYKWKFSEICFSNYKVIWQRNIVLYANIQKCPFIICVTATCAISGTNSTKATPHPEIIQMLRKKIGIQCNS